MLYSRYPEDIEQLSPGAGSVKPRLLTITLLINQSSAETQGVWEVCDTHTHLTYLLAKMRVCVEFKKNSAWHLLTSYDILRREQKKLNISQTFLLQNK